jgi:hypothetical protein
MRSGLYFWHLPTGNALRPCRAERVVGVCAQGFASLSPRLSNFGPMGLGWTGTLVVFGFLVAESSMERGVSPVLLKSTTDWTVSLPVGLAPSRGRPRATDTSLARQRLRVRD